MDAGMVSPPRRLGWAVFGLVLAVLLTTYSGRLDASLDGRFMVNLTHQLLDGGGLTVLNPATGEEEMVKYGVALSLAYLPLDLLGKVVQGLMPQGLSFAAEVREMIAGTLHPLLGAATAAVLAMLLVSFGATRRVAAAGGVLAVFTTPLWVYANANFSESLQALLVALLFYLLGPGAAGAPRRAAAWAGLVAGAMLLTKVTLLFAVPVVTAYALWLRRWTVREVLWLLPGFLMGVAVFAGYNHLRFGSAFETGYGSEAGMWTEAWWVGVFGMTLYPGKSVFWFAPLTVLLPAAWVGRWWTGRPRWLPLTVCAAVLVAVFVVGYAKWYSWQGGMAFAPRFVVPVLPLAAAAAVPVAAAWWRRAGWRRGVVVLLAAGGVLTQLAGTLQKLNTTYDHGLGSECVLAMTGIEPFDHEKMWAVTCWPPAQVTQGQVAARRLPVFLRAVKENALGRETGRVEGAGFDLWWAYLIFFGRKGVLMGAAGLALCLGLVAWRGRVLWQETLLPLGEKVAEGRMRDQA